jgi:hypothetical protein
VNRLQQIENLLVNTLTSQDVQVNVYIKRNSFGWLHLTVISSVFEEWDDDERQKQRNAILETADLNLRDYPFSNYQLLTPRRLSVKTEFANRIFTTESV